MRFKLTIPTKLSEIKLSQYQKFHKTTDGSEDLEFISRQLVGIFCKLSDDVVGKIPKKDFNSIVETITKTLNLKSELITLTKHNGIQYGFIPSIENITVDEAADLDTYMGEVSKFDKAMAVLYRPTISSNNDKYLIKDYEGKGESLDLTMDLVNGALVFFYNLRKDLLSCTLNYIQKEVERKPKKYKTLEKNGDGIKTSMQLLKGTYLPLRKLVS